jgi:hypothetical protein
LDSFALVKVDVKWICTHCIRREEMIVNMIKAIDENP